MSFFALPSTNLHSPTAIGDVAPNTIKGTTITTTGNILPSVNLGSNLGASDTYINAAYIANLNLFAGFDIAVPRTVNASSTGISFDVSTGCFWYTGANFGGAIDVALIRTGTNTISVQDGSSGAAAIKAKLTTATNATTGLTAGVLSALTTSSIVIYDGTGTAYRVPCITP